MASWVAFVAEYYEATHQDAKRLWSSALSPIGRQSIDAQERPDWLPHLGVVQQYIAKSKGPEALKTT